MSNTAAGGWAAGSSGGGDLAIAAREPVVAMSVAAGVRAFREPLALLAASAEAAAMLLRMPLGESDAPAVVACRTPLDGSGAPPGVGLLTPVDTVADVGATGLWPTRDESAGLIAEGGTNPGSAPVAAALLGVPTPGARGAAPAVPGGWVVELTGVRLGGALAAVGLAPWPLAGGIPKPAGDAALWESWGESDF